MPKVAPHLERMGIPSLWSTTFGEGVTVALLDSGVATSTVLPASRVDCFDSDGRASASITNEHGTLCLREVTNDGVTTNDVTALRVMGFLAIDVTLYQFR